MSAYNTVKTVLEVANKELFGGDMFLTDLTFRFKDQCTNTYRKQLRRAEMKRRKKAKLRTK